MSTQERSAEQQVMFAEQINALRKLRSELLKERENCQSGAPERSDEPADRADRAIDTASRVLSASTIEHLTRRIREVETALERAEEGTYGICADCERPIARTRLQANPAAQRCLECQSAHETARRSA